MCSIRQIQCVPRQTDPIAIVLIDIVPNYPAISHFIDLPCSIDMSKAVPGLEGHREGPALA